MKNIYIVILFSFFTIACSNPSNEHLPKTIIYSGDIKNVLGLDSILIVYNNQNLIDSIFCYKNGELLQFDKIDHSNNSITAYSFNKKNNWDRDIWHSEIDLDDNNRVLKFSLFRKDTLTHIDSLIYDSKGILSKSYSIFVDIYTKKRLPPEYESQYTYDSNNDIEKTIVYKTVGLNRNKYEEIEYKTSYPVPNFYINNSYMFFLIDHVWQDPLFGSLMSKNCMTLMKSSLSGEKTIEYTILNDKIIERRNKNSVWYYKY
jgi:hypothetical protein